MVDPYRKPSSGDPLNFPAELRGEIIDTVQFVRHLKRSETPSLDRMARDRGLVKIKNESGSAVDRFGILGIDGIISAITPTNNLKAWKNEPVLSGITPATPTHLEKFVILVEPLADDAIGWGCLSGVVPVQVAFTYSDSPYAHPANSDDAKLEDNEAGVPVLYKESGTGTKWALVQMGTFCYPTITGTLDADLNASSSCTMSVTGGSSLSDTSRNVTVNAHSITASKKIASENKMTAIFRGGKWWQEVPGACEVDQ